MCTREGGDQMETIEGKPDVTKFSDKPEKEHYPWGWDKSHREYFREMMRRIFKKETTVDDKEVGNFYTNQDVLVHKEVGNFYTNQDVLVQPEKEDFVFSGIVIGGEQKNGIQYIRVIYKNIEGKNKEQLFPEDELVDLNERYKIDKKDSKSEHGYSDGDYVLVKFKETEVIVAAKITNSKRGDGIYKVQVVEGDNSIFDCTKEELDKYNTSKDIEEKLPNTTGTNEIEVEKRFFSKRFIPVFNLEKGWKQSEDDASDEDRYKIKNTNPEDLIIINQNDLNYVGCSIPLENGESEINYIDEENKIWSGFVKTTNGIKAKDIYEYIKKEGGDYKVGDMVFVKFGAGVVLARINEIDDEGYTLYLGEKTIGNEEGKNERRKMYVRRKKEDVEKTTNRELEKLNNPQKKRELPERFRPDWGEKTLDCLPSTEADRERIKNTKPENIAVVNRPCVCYVGCIMPEIDGEGTNGVMFQDGEGYIHTGYLNTVDNIKALDIYKKIKDKEGNYEVGDIVFARFEKAVAIAEIKEIKNKGYVLNFGQTIEEGDEGREIKDAIEFRSKKEIEETVREELKKLNN